MANFIFNGPVGQVADKIENNIYINSNSHEKETSVVDIDVEEVKEENQMDSSDEPLSEVKGKIKNRQYGRIPEPLFKNTEGNKNGAFTQEWATLFVEYLKLHKAYSKVIDTTIDNYISKTFVVFYEVWKKKNLVSLIPNGNACYRFLQEDCALQMKAEKKTYANHIRNMINEAKNLDLIDIESNVRTFLNTHKK